MDKFCWKCYHPNHEGKVCQFEYDGKCGCKGPEATVSFVTQREILAREFFETMIFNYRPSEAHRMDICWRNAYGLWDGEKKEAYKRADKVLKKLGAG